MFSEKGSLTNDTDSSTIARVDAAETLYRIGVFKLAANAD
jgi:hypothetical protein